MDVITIARIALQNDAGRLSSISHNLANATTPGFKRQLSVEQSFQAQLDQAGAMLRLPGLATGALDMRAAALQSTGIDSDIAIEGDSFFELATADGPLYTRHGNLSSDNLGRLVSAQGWPVMGEQGEIRVGAGAFSVSPNGDVRQGEHVLGRLKRVRFDLPAQMLPAGAGQYAAGTARIVDHTASDPLRHGVREASNVNTAAEMVALTATVRHAEAMHRVIQGHDEALEKAIRKLGEF